jgi:hypothetical protein
MELSSDSSKQPSCSSYLISIPKGEYIHFLHIALGSLRELDTQLIIAREVGLVETHLIAPVLEEVDKLQGILVSSLQKLKSSTPSCLLPPAFCLLLSSNQSGENVG